MPEDSFEMIHFEGTTHALRGLSRGHHKMFDEKLAASVEQIAQRYLSVRSIEHVFLPDLHPRQRLALGSQLVAQSRKLLFPVQQYRASGRPFFGGYDSMTHNRCVCRFHSFVLL